jgi:hypothetical protein
MSNTLIKCLLLAYIVIMGVCVAERNWPKALYWFAASLLQVSIIWGFK